MATSDDFPLHKSVFKGDIKRVSQLIRTCDVSQKDIHGNTPLHLAVMLGHKECVALLLAHGAPVKIKNAQGWTPLAESISYGDRQTILLLLRKLKQQSRECLEERRPNIVQALKDIGDFDLELKWDFQSWVPLVSRMLPSDICRIRKKGSQIRLDTTLVDFTEMRWERGDISFVFDGEAQQKHSLTVLDNNLKVFQRVRYEVAQKQNPHHCECTSKKKCGSCVIASKENKNKKFGRKDSDMELEEEVDILMSSDIMAAQMSTKKISFTRSQSGWLYRHDKSESIGEFKSHFYQVNNLLLESKKRREHLSAEDIQKNKSIMENITKGSWENAEASTNEQRDDRRRSLKCPDKSTFSWEDYRSAPPTEHPSLGRPKISKESSKTFKATIAMSDDFPMTVRVLLDVLEVVAPFKQFQKLRDFMTSKLPPGFPVRIEIPVFPTISAKVTFTGFKWVEGLEPDLFRIPPDFREDPGRFPDL